MKTKQEPFVKRLNGQSNLHKRPFFKLPSSKVLLGIGLVFSFAGPMIFPKAIRAQDAKQELVQKQKLTVVQLEKPLAQLEKETSKMAADGNAMSDGTRFTSKSASVLTGQITFIADMSDMHLTVAFDATLDAPGPNAGMRGADLHDFAKLVEKQTGKKLEGVKIILDTGTFTYNGKQAPYTNAYLLPIDSQGKITTALGDGKYLVYGASYYADNHVAGEPGILIEPNRTYSLSLAYR